MRNLTVPLDLYVKKCQEYWHAGTSPTFVGVCLPQLISCFVSLFLVVSFGFKFFRKGNYHPNAKIIVFVQLSFVAIFCTEYFYALLKYFYNVFNNYREPCAFVDFTEDCSIFYYSHFISLAGMSFTQMSLSAERFISSHYVKTYETFGRTLGIFCACLAIIFSILVSWLSLHGYEPGEMRLTCLGSPYSATPILLYMALISCDFVSISLFIFSWIASKRNDQQYVLGTTYQKREIRNVIKMFAPVNIAHFLVYCFYAIATAILRMHVNTLDPDLLPVLAIIIMLVPYYTTFELIVLHIMLNKADNVQKDFKKNMSYLKKEAEKDQYFDVLAKQWN